MSLRACLRFLSFPSQFLNDASATLLLLMASILLNLPIAFSGATGLVNSLSSLTSVVNRFIFRDIEFFKMVFSSLVMTEYFLKLMNSVVRSSVIEVTFLKLDPG